MFPLSLLIFESPPNSLSLAKDLSVYDFKGNIYDYFGLIVLIPL